MKLFISQVRGGTIPQSILATIPNAPGAQVYGINPEGTALVGYYQPSSGINAGFVYQNSTLITLQFPGSVETYAMGINSAGEVVGYYAGSDKYYAFTWTPPADAARK